MLRYKDIKIIQELKADHTPSRVSAEDIFSRVEAERRSFGVQMVQGTGI